MGGQRLALISQHFIAARPGPLPPVCTAATAASAGGAPCLDFAYSFIAGAGPLCAIRFVLESKCTVFDDNHGTVKVYYQCASCKSEDTFGKGTKRSGLNLFQVRQLPLPRVATAFGHCHCHRLRPLPTATAFGHCHSHCHSHCHCHCHRGRKCHCHCHCRSPRYYHRRHRRRCHRHCRTAGLPNAMPHITALAVQHQSTRGHRPTCTPAGP